MNDENDWKIEKDGTYLYTVCETNDTICLTLRCKNTGRMKYATIGVDDKGVWEQ